MLRNGLMVSCVFFVSEQLLFYAKLPKNASKYPKMAFLIYMILQLTEFRWLKMYLHFFGHIKAS